MSDDNEKLVPVFMPALSVVLLNAEDKKGEPLTYDEVIRTRDKSPCIMMRVDHVQQMAESRGYDDIDPDNCWYDWQQLRRELGRKPELDPGPKFNQINTSNPEYQRTIHDAQNSLNEFRSMLPADGHPRFNALVKSKIIDGDNSAFMWLSNTRMNGSNFVAEFFEVPATFKNYAVGDTLEIPPDSLLDWMVNDDGVLHGGFSIRFQRSQLPENERPAYDAHLGVTAYA
jgi:uncharacterized protein YegJ (DUF2314 family)